jgi:hypothetical protein
MASINNDGRRLYTSAKFWENKLLPHDRTPNFIHVDFFRATTAGALPINVVDACNRLNYERFGIDWEHSECFWELYPYEFDDSKVEHTSRIPAIQVEVAKAGADFKAEIELDGHESRGKIVSTSVTTSITMWLDWKRIPEWAVDNDFSTRWSGVAWPSYVVGCIGRAVWGIDLGERRSIDEIAIAWEYPHSRPRYIVFASNDDSKFADGIDSLELYFDDGWEQMAKGVRVTGGTSLLWDKQAFSNPYGAWRYIKIMVLDLCSSLPGLPEQASIWEVKLYGPAD